MSTGIEAGYGTCEKCHAVCVTVYSVNRGLVCIECAGILHRDKREALHPIADKLIAQYKRGLLTVGDLAQALVEAEVTYDRDVVAPGWHSLPLGLL